MTEQYGARLDPVVYSEHTRDYTREDWIRLARAALDQASTREDAQYLCVRAHADGGP